MSTFIYNGIVLVPVKTVEIEEAPVFSDDNTDFLWMRYRITIDALYNPQTTAYTVDEFGDPIPEPGVYGPLTDEAIRFALMQPRAQLIYGFTLPAGRSAQIMISPGNFLDGSRYITDANNGPIPIFCRIKRVDGNKTFHISYCIETCVRECDFSNDCALISNRFSQSVDYDDRHRAIKTTTGRAMFRTDLLYAEGQLADDFRARIFPQVSPGMRRTNIRVTVSSTQNILDWSCTDIEQMHELGETDPRQGGSGVLNINFDYKMSTVQQEFGGKLPVAIIEASVYVEGNKYATNFNLIQAALVVASTRLPVDNPDAILMHCAVGSVMTDRKVMISVVYRVNPPAVGLPGLNQLPLGFLAGPAPFADYGGIYPTFPNDGGTRGTQLEALVSAALKEACGDCADSPPCNQDEKGFGWLGTYCGPGPALEVQVVQFVPTEPNKYRTTVPPTHSYEIHSHYEDDSGNRQGTATGSGDEDSEVIQVRSRRTRRIVSWTCESYKQVPSVPPRTTNDENETFLYGYVTPTSVCVMPDGRSPCYRISGEYVYAHTKPKGVGDTLPFDVPPWVAYDWGQDSEGAQLSIYGGQSEGSNYSHGIIDSAEGQSSLSVGETA